ncbi:ATP-binding protein [Marinoscillum sp.]|uniref:ATP-binding protein n=2 Tax=Marinoscillum sp. TaxID=2024838 RepID=UPI003873537E
MLRYEKIFGRLVTVPKQMGWAFFILLLCLTQLIAFRIYTMEKDAELHIAEREAIFLKGQLEASLNHSITATRVLAFLVEKDLLDNNFDSICENLLQQNPFIDALQLVKGGTIVNTYPLVGNEASIGYNIGNDSAHREEAEQAKLRGELYFEGPINLIQGGKGIVGRVPISRNGEFWGFSAVIIRHETLLRALNLDSTGMNDRFIYQLVKIHTGGAESNPYFQHVETIDRGIFSEVDVPIGDWIIYVKMKHPQYWVNAMAFSLLGILLSALLGIFSWFLAAQPMRLRALVALKTKDLNTANKTLQKKTRELEFSNSELEQFAYVASHDLQEPLRMVTGFLTQLEKKYLNQLDEKPRQYIHFAKDGAIRMKHIILDLLEFSRVRTLDDAIEQIDTHQMVNEVCMLEKRNIEGKNATIDTQNLPVIQYYRIPFLRILRNLIGNALKYSKPGMSPVITIASTAHDDFWQFSISDNGLGITEEHFEKIFVLFHQVDPSLGGSGMGLAITKKLVENLGGQIWVESAANAGSTFYFTIPRIQTKENQ